MSKWESFTSHLIRIAGAWGPVAGVVGIFTLGAAGTVFLYERFDKFPKSEEVEQRISQVEGRVARAETDHRSIQRQVLEQYMAINSRLDTQNSLIMNVLQRIPSKTEANNEDSTSTASLVPLWFRNLERGGS